MAQGTSAATAHQCAGGGFIVGPRQHVPADEHYFQTPDAEFVVGCNRLRCTLCGRPVRQQAGFRDGPGAPNQARAIYEEQDWTRSPHLIADPNSRLYACGCSIIVVTGAQAAAVPNHVWTCAGHPAPMTGTVLPPMTMDAAKNFVCLLANMQLSGSIRQIALTKTDGSGYRAVPEFLSLGADWPVLRVWTTNEQQAPETVDFGTIAGACAQATDGALQTF